MGFVRIEVSGELRYQLKDGPVTSLSPWKAVTLSVEELADFTLHVVESMTVKLAFSESDPSQL